MMKKSLALSSLAAAVMVASSAMPTIASAEISGNIGVYSQYLLRGGVESDSPVLQGGLDYAHESGFYAGWWASNLGYGYDKTGADVSKGIEHDLYFGYAGEVKGFSYDIGLIQYVYMNVDDSNLLELVASVGYGPFTLGMKHLLKDGWWGNQGDTYLTLGAEFALPKDFTLGATAGFYVYEDDDNAKLCAPSPAGCGTTTESSAFRHADITLSHPIGNTGADMGVTYMIGGDARDGSKYDNQFMLSVSYGFDI